ELKTQQSRPKVVALSTTVMKHLADLRIAFGRENDRARSALRKLVSQVVLRRHGDRLMAEVTGNIKDLIAIDDEALDVEKDGSGGWILGVTDKTDSTGLTDPWGRRLELRRRSQNRD